MALKISPDYIERGLTAAASMGTSAALGFMHGRLGDVPEKFGVPADLGGGVVLGLVSVSGVLPKAAVAPVFGAALACLGYYSAALGGRAGQKARKAAVDKNGVSLLTGTPNTRTITGAAWDMSGIGSSAAHVPRPAVGSPHAQHFTR